MYFYTTESNCTLHSLHLVAGSNKAYVESYMWWEQQQKTDTHTHDIDLPFILREKKDIKPRSYTFFWC